MEDHYLLQHINTPEDLKHLSVGQLQQLSEEVRQFIIDIVSQNTGHLGASLGVVELTVALHYVFNTPYDQIIWDVGHQAYGHKILTGRKDVFHTNRKYKGISGFPKREESKYDAFGVGHSSTSISAALGMAIAAKKKNEHDRKIVAVIGDGSLTGGEAFEGLNNAGHLNTDLLVVLNDNNIAIDPNVGALKDYLVDITTSQVYNKFKDDIWHMLGKLSKLGQNAQRLAQNIENSVKSFLLNQSNLFESLNFRYFGPVDGHDVVHLTKVLNDLKHIGGPKLLHCITKKGKGFKLAEEDQTYWHAPGKFCKKTGKIYTFETKEAAGNKYQEVFGNTLVELAEKNEKIIGITPAMPTGSSMNVMMKKMPDRVYDVGIAEQHAVTFSAGLATQGLIPFCNIYSTFMQRAYDQIIHDVALQNLPVIFCLDRAGLVGSDGATHHGAFDIAYMRCIPNITFCAPMDETELRNMMYTAQLNTNGPFAIRYPKGYGTGKEWKRPFKKIAPGKGRKLRDGNDIAILSIGHVGNFVAESLKQFNEFQLDAAHYDMRFIKPLDENMLHSIFKKFNNIITVEDGTIKGGFGSAVLEFMNEHHYKAGIKMLGIPDRFIEQGSQNELYKECGFDKDSIHNTLQSYVHNGVLTHPE
jgi:1-deoxy-D-xylulose-5-phosphate synthase